MLAVEQLGVRMPAADPYLKGTLLQARIGRAQSGGTVQARDLQGTSRFKHIATTPEIGGMGGHQACAALL